MENGFELWREQRQAELAAPESWLGLIGLFWLEPGPNAVGMAPDCVVRLPDGPARLGVLDWQGENLIWRPEEGEPVGLRTDSAGDPSRVACGSLAFFVIEREGRLAVRLRDLSWRDRRNFAGLAGFQPGLQPALRLHALRGLPLGAAGKPAAFPGDGGRAALQGRTLSFRRVAAASVPGAWLRAGVPAWVRP